MITPLESAAVGAAAEGVATDPDIAAVDDGEATAIDCFIECGAPQRDAIALVVQNGAAVAAAVEARLDGESHIESIEAEVDDPIGGAAVKSAALVIAERIEDAISVLQEVAAC